MAKSNRTGKPSASLLRYLRALVDKYPIPVRATQLAELVGVTKASVTKVHTRLIDFCDTKIAASSRSFVLKSDIETFSKVFLEFALTGAHREFLHSRYVANMISGERVHAVLSKTIPNYDQYFEPEDTLFLITRLLDFLVKLDPSLVVEVLKSLIENSSHTIPIQLISEIEEIVPAIFAVKNDSEFFELMKVRDKTFFLVRDFLWTKIETLAIVKSKDIKERANYVAVYKDTVDYYLKSYVDHLDITISKAFNKDDRLRWKIPTIGTVVLELNNGEESD